MSLNNLRVLSLAGNPLTSLHMDTPSVALAGLASLDISRCQIGTFDNIDFATVSNLTSLNISFGKVKVMSKSGLRLLSRLKNLDIRGNDIIVTEPGGPTEHPPPPQEPSTMVPKCTLGCPEHNLTFPRTAIGMHWSYSPLRKGTLLRSPGR